MASLAPFIAGRTTIVISHRASVAAGMDRTVRLEERPREARSPPRSAPAAGSRPASAGTRGRRVHAIRVVGEVEVERVRAVVLGLEVEVAAGAVGLVAARRVEERHEAATSSIAAAVERRRPVSRRGRAVELEAERAGPMGGTELPVRGRDLERGRLRAGVRLERQVLEAERSDRPGSRGDPAKVVPDLVRERARWRVLNQASLSARNVLDRRRRSRARARARARGRGRARARARASCQCPPDDGLRLLDDPLEMVVAEEALGVDLVDVLGPRRSCREPAVVGHDLEPADRRRRCRAPW